MNFKSLFCNHKYKTHYKKVYEWNETEIVNGTQNWYKPLTEISQFSETVEVLICENCGTIKKIVY